MKKPETVLERSVPRTSFAAAAAAGSPLPAAGAALSSKTAVTAKTSAAATASDEGDKPSPPAAANWGFSKKKPRRTMFVPLVFATCLVVCGSGGYAAYLWYFQKAPFAVAGTGEVETDALAADPLNDSDAAGETLSDPFDDERAVATAAKGASATKEPRRVESSPGAMPIVRRNALRDSLALDDDAADDSDDSEPPTMEQSEPVLGDEKARPSLAGHEPPVRRPAPGGPNQKAGSQHRQPSSGPRLAVSDDDDPHIGNQFRDDRLDGYGARQKPVKDKIRSASGSAAISIVEAVDDDLEQDDRFDGYVPQDSTTRRAISKTVVVRPTDGVHRFSGPPATGALSGRREQESRFGASSDDEAPLAPAGNADRRSTRTGRDMDDGLARRMAPVVPAADARPGSNRHAGPAGEIYRVSPDDNFWNISRRQYGTARYYQALIRHNQERVPDPQRLRPGTQILTPPASVLELRYPELIEKAAPVSAPVPAGGGLDRSAMRPRFEKPLADDRHEEPIARTEGETAESGYFYGRNGEPLYRIGVDDTLTGIAQRHLGRASRWQEIYEKNQDVLKSPDNLTLGAVIRLPGDASRLSLVPSGERRR